MAAHSSPDRTARRGQSSTDAAVPAMKSAREGDFKALLEDAILWLGEDATVADLKDYDPES